MNSTEKLIDRDLTELLGGDTPPDLISRTLARIEAGEDSHVRKTTGSHEPEAQQAPAGRLVLFRRLATAACVALVVGLMTWVLWPQPLPEPVSASTGANYLVRDDHIQLNQGWLLINDGAPQVRTDSGRVSVAGRAVVGPAIPGDDALDSLADEFGLSAEERAMFKLKERWVTAASLALCLFAGHATVNGEVVKAEDLPSPEVLEAKIKIPAHDDIEGVRKLVRSAVKVEVMVEDRRVILDDLFDVRRITEALTADGFATSEKNLTWDPWDGVTMYLKDGRKIETSGLSWEEDVYDMRLPGTEGYYTYATPDGAHDVLSEYFQRAKNVVSPEPTEIEKVRELFQSASSITVNRYGRILKITDLTEVRRITAALASGEMEYSDMDLSEYDPYDWVWFNLPNGESIRAVGLSQGSDSEKGYFDALLPGWESMSAYSIPAEALPILKDLFQRALKQPKQGEFGVLRKWEGADSEITEARCEIVADEEAWSALWMEHTINPADDPVNPPKLPDVDFDSEMVVAVFGGKSVNSRGFYVQQVLNARNGWVIRVDESTYQSASSGDDDESGGAQHVTPYGIWVIPNDGGSILVEENVQGMKNRGPRWKTIGSRLGTDDLRDDTKDYFPTHTITLQGGPDVSQNEYKVVRTLDDWHVQLARISDNSFHWPDPDFSDEIAIVAYGKALNGKGNFVLDVWGRSASALHLRLIAPNAQSGANPTYSSIFGVWILNRHELDIVIETPKYGRIGQPAQWDTTVVAKRSDQPFGILDDVYGTTDETGSQYLLIDNQADLEKHVENTHEGWVDWKTERVVLIRHEQMRVFVGMSASVVNSDDAHVITYSLTAPSGVLADPIAQFLVLKIKKPTKTLVIEQSLTTGPAPAAVKEVARFER